MGPWLSSNHLEATVVQSTQTISRQPFLVVIMTNSISTSFAQITENNHAVDQMIELLVHEACTRDEVAPRTDRKELAKTTHLLFLSSLVLGERNDTEFDDTNVPG